MATCSRFFVLYSAKDMALAILERDKQLKIYLLLVVGRPSTGQGVVGIYMYERVR